MDAVALAAVAVLLDVLAPASPSSSAADAGVPLAQPGPLEAHRLPQWDYAMLRELVRDVRLPAMIVDLDLFDANVRRFSALAQRQGKTVRLATKSVRVPDLIVRALQVGAPTFQGLMCFSAAEARYWGVDAGLDDLMIAYPSAVHDLGDVWVLAVEHHKTVQVMVDCPAHIAQLDAFWSAQQAASGRGSVPRVQVCMDMDCSYQLAGQHLGANRSPLRSLDAVAALVQAIKRSRHVDLVGVMGYEAQVSGVQNINPFEPAWLMAAVRWIQRVSFADVMARRGAVRALLASEGIQLRYINGGGSGNLAQAASDPAVTEVTAGSGLLQSHLFDYFEANANVCAFAYGLRVTRVPTTGMATCHSGGFAASGKTTADKSPILFLPHGARLSPEEGFGEVQTPLYCPPGLALQVGDPVFARPAKAGEIAERFQSYLLKRGSVWAGSALTYRGLGLCFY